MPPQPPASTSDFRGAVTAYERQLLEDALKRNRFNQRATAVALGLSYDQLRQLVAYNQWANERILTAIDGMTAEAVAFREADVGAGSYCLLCDGSCKRFGYQRLVAEKNQKRMFRRRCAIGDLK